MHLFLALACSTPQPSAPLVTDDVIRVGTVLPLEGDPALAVVGTAARDMLIARFATREPIHGRRIELVARHAPMGGLVAAARALTAEVDASYRSARESGLVHFLRLNKLDQIFRNRGLL